MKMLIQPRHTKRHRAMLEAYGFGLFPFPDYREARCGDWRIVHHLPSLADGYASGPAVEAERYVLYHKRTPWMSTGLMEQESHAFHVKQANGLVVVAGLGLGMYAFAAACKPQVDRVIVLERSPEVMALVRQAVDVDAWPGGDKLRFVQAEALKPDMASSMRGLSEGRHPDYLYADIWATCAAPQAAMQTAAIVGALRPRAAGWWGQELAFGLWCREQRRPPDAASLQAYAVASGVPIPESGGYLAFCRDVIAANGVLVRRRDPRLSWRQRWWPRSGESDHPAKSRLS